MTKPFDLEKALSGHPVICRDGTKVIKWCHFPIPDYVHGAIMALLIGEDRVNLFFGNGKFHFPGEHAKDLFLEVKTVKRWARMIMNNGAPEVWELNFHSKESAEFQPGHTFLPAYEYEVEE